MPSSINQKQRAIMIADFGARRACGAKLMVGATEKHALGRNRIDEEQYALLRKCVELGDAADWNRWRDENRDTKVWLQGADLDSVAARPTLRQINLRRANLSRARLSESILVGADLRQAVLVGATLRKAILVNADRRGASAKALAGGSFGSQGIREPFGFASKSAVATLSPIPPQLSFARSIVSSILNGSVALTAWGMFAGMSNTCPVLTLWDLPPTRKPPSPSST